MTEPDVSVGVLKYRPNAIRRQSVLCRVVNKFQSVKTRHPGLGSHPEIIVAVLYYGIDGGLCQPFRNAELVKEIILGMKDTRHEKKIKKDYPPRWTNNLFPARLVHINNLWE